MISKIFIDTNILIYAMDNFDPEKRDRCRFILRELEDKKNIGVVSTQVLQEFYIIATKKLDLDPLMVKDILHTFEHFEIITITLDMIKDAIDCNIFNKISFWDSLIIIAADYSKCEQLWTEDMNHGQVIRGVKIINPLIAAGEGKD